MLKLAQTLCGNDIEKSAYYLLQCPTYTHETITLLDKFKRTNYDISELSDAVVTKIILFGDNNLSTFYNTLILNSTIDYVISTKRFDDSILTMDNKQKTLSGISVSFFILLLLKLSMVYFNLLILVWTKFLIHFQFSQIMHYLRLPGYYKFFTLKCVNAHYSNNKQM